MREGSDEQKGGGGGFVHEFVQKTSKSRILKGFWQERL